MKSTLSLFALKCRPRIFDLSSGQTHASVRDQIVRAHVLVRDLQDADRALRSVLIIGAGVAGVSAALAAGARGIRAIVVDVNDRPFALQHRTKTRFVGPFMYEWPAMFCYDQSYPPSAPNLWPNVGGPTLAWSSTQPMKASKLASMLDKSLCKQLGSMTHSPLLLMNVKRSDVEACVRGFPENRARFPPLVGNLWHGTLDSSATSSKPFNPDYILLSAGMGPEKTVLSGMSSPGTTFWSNDSLRHNATTNKKVLVVGGGDGALQDVLRAITRFDHPLQFIRYLYDDPSVTAILQKWEPQLLTIQQQYQLFGAWSYGDACDRVGHAEIDRHCIAIARQIAQIPSIQTRVANGVRKGTGRVALTWDGNAFTKTYLLNRFAVHLINECQSAAGSHWPKDRMFLELFPSRETLVTKPAGAGGTVELRNTSSRVHQKISMNVDVIVVRIGTGRAKTPGEQMVGLSSKQRAQRTTLRGIPLPYVLA